LTWDGAGRRKVSLAGSSTSVTKIVLSHEELALLLGGIDLNETQRRKWYRKPLMEESEKLRIPA
jgi:hypothetical protein